MKKNNKIVFNENIFTMFLILLAGIILIGLIIYDLKKSDTFSEDKKKNILYIEIFLSFIASSILLLWMTYFLRSFIINYSLVLILTSPFSLLIIRSFLQNKSYIKFISILTIISTLFSMYFTYGAAMH